jgi:carboxyl-terminal processing protease
MMADQVGYVRPETLAPGKVKDVAAAVKKLEAEGAKKLVLDLRNCSVGGPEEGVALASLFVSKGLITYLQGQRVPRKDFEAQAGQGASSLPLAVITNRGTANGAEIAAAAILDNKRAQVVGERTYGDASLRRAITMDDGGAIILSVAKYYSPSGKAIQDTGVTPGVLVNEPESQMELDENGDPVEAAEPQKKPEEDPLLKKAVETLGNPQVAAKAAAAQ